MTVHLNGVARAILNTSRAASTVQTPSAGPGGQRTAPLAVDARRIGAGTGKASGPGNSRTKAAPGSRFAHFAGMSAMAPIADEPVITDITPHDAAAFVMASAAKARGQKPAAAQVKPPAAGKPATAAKADLSTPEGIAAFVAASAAKCRAPSR